MSSSLKRIHQLELTEFCNFFEILSRSHFFAWAASWQLILFFSTTFQVFSSQGHREGNSDSTSIHYDEIREETFKFNSGNLNYLPEVSFKWKKDGPN